MKKTDKIKNTSDFSDFVGSDSNYDGHTCKFVGSDFVGGNNLIGEDDDNISNSIGSLFKKVTTAAKSIESKVASVASKAKGLVGSAAGSSAAAQPAQGAATGGSSSDSGADTGSTGSSSTSSGASTQTPTAPTGGNTMMYVGIVVAVLVVGVVVLMVMKKGK